MKKIFDLEFCFKGSRTYVQGPDIFDTTIKLLLKNFQNITNLKYTAYKILHKNARLTIIDKFIKQDHVVINSIISFKCEDKKYYAVISDNQKDIECSIHYSEEDIEQQSIISKNCISFQNNTSYSFTEIIVSMNKYFLSQTVNESGKWIVTKFDYVNLENIKNIVDECIKLELLQNLNNTLTKSKVFLNNQEVGYIYFSLIPKGK